MGLKKYQMFVFDNQKGDAVYWFTSDALMKRHKFPTWTHKSNVGLNWLLDDKCSITTVLSERGN